jgi:hypothetical protein
MLVHIKPLKSIVVHPITQQVVPKEGLEVMLDSYWERRLNAGDVAITEKKKSAQTVIPTVIPESPKG